MTTEERIKRLETQLYYLARQVQDLQKVECPENINNVLDMQDYEDLL